MPDDRESKRDNEPVGDRVRIYRRRRAWYANFQHAGKQRRVSLKTTSKKEARRLAVQLEAELADSRWKPDAAPAAIEDAIAAYRDFLRAEERSPKTLAKYMKVF